MENLDDSVFSAFAKQVKETETSKATRGQSQADYEELQWTGLETGRNKFFRLLGSPPGFSKAKKPWEAVEIAVCDVKDSDGKRMKLRLPLKTDQQATDHIVHRLYAKVTEAEWINKKRVNKYETKYPELWAAVTKTGFKPDEGQSYTYATGLKPKQVVVYNVIDRNDEWCAENKHTKLLSKQVNVVERTDGSMSVFADTGIPSYGFIQKLADCIAKYGNYEKFDIAIKRTGEKTSPYELRNISRLKEKDILEEVINDDGSDIEVDKIVIGALTADEAAYEKYDLDNLFKPTSYTKIMNRLGNVFKLCDATLGSKFFDELQALAAKEKEEWEREHGTSDADTAKQEAAESKSIQEASQATENPKPSRRAAVGPATNLSQDKMKLLLGYSQLTDEQKLWIKDVNVNTDGTLKDVVWIDEKANSLLYCDNCNKMSPSDLAVCPACASTFDEA